MQPLKNLPVRAELDETLIDEFFTEENFNHLVKCTVHYAGLLGKNIEIPEGTLLERLNILYHSFAAILPEGQGLNFHFIDGRIKWIIYYVHDWEERMFYWMPVNFINRLSGRIAKISKLFMQLFIGKNHLAPFDYCCEYEFIFEVASENINYHDYSDSEKNVLRDLLYSYSEGEISVFLNEMYDKNIFTCSSFVDTVTVALEKHVPENPLETKLIGWLKKGLPFISEDCIMNYDYDPYNDSLSVREYGYDYDLYGDEYESVSLDRIIRFIYDTGDYVTGELEQVCNQHIMESYAAVPTSFMIVNPDSDLFAPGNYPERFSEWYFEMIEITKEINSHE
jgi:hypothetical protein